MAAAFFVEQALLLGSLLKDNRPAARSGGIGHVMIVTSLILSAIAFGFLLYAAYIWASERYGVQIASAGIGASVLLLSLCMMAGAVYYNNRHLIKLKRFSTRSANKAEALLATVLEALEDPIKENPKLSILVSALTGYKAGKSVQ